MKIQYSKLKDHKEYRYLKDDRFIYRWDYRLNDWYNSAGFKFDYYHNVDDEVEAIPRILTDKELEYLSRLLTPYKKMVKHLGKTNEFSSHSLYIFLEYNGEKREIILPFLEYVYHFDGMEDGKLYTPEELDIR